MQPCRRFTTQWGVPRADSQAIQNAKVQVLLALIDTASHRAWPAQCLESPGRKLHALWQEPLRRAMGDAAAKDVGEACKEGPLNEEQGVQEKLMSTVSLVVLVEKACCWACNSCESLEDRCCFFWVSWHRRP